MKSFIASTIAILFLFAFTICGQERIESKWNWIVLFSTTKNDVEKRLGESISDDKTHPYQTYQTDFGKITIIYAGHGVYIKQCSCSPKTGTVIGTYISPMRLKLSDLNFDLSTFKKDDSYSPRELQYFSQDIGVYITTSIADIGEKEKAEIVVAIQYRPKCGTSSTTARQSEVCKAQL